MPAYNAEDFISKCIDSIVSQSLDESTYEVLIINDGSTDATSEIVCKYIDRFKNIKLITQENKGLAETRNVGIKKSCGRYIWFIDSDDYIVRNCVNDLLNFSENNDLDMFLVAPEAKVTENFQEDWKERAPIEIVKGRALLETGRIDVGAWAYLFKKSFIEKNGLRFLSGYLFEDSEFTPRALLYAKSVGLLRFSVYNYIQHEKSIMHNFSPNRLHHYIGVAGAMYQFCRENNNDLIVQRFFSAAAAGLVLAGFKAIATHNLPRQYLISYVDECRSSGLLPLRQVDANYSRIVAMMCASRLPTLYIGLLRGKRLIRLLGLA